MSDWILSNEAALRLGFFISVFALMAGWELMAPRRRLQISKLTRWANNLALSALNTLLIRLLLPTAAVGMAVWAGSAELGLFNRLPAPLWLATLISVILLDGVIYWQHRLFHQIPLLWRLHQVHHADLDIDVTTAARFHPIEMLLSMAIKLTAVLLLGAPVLAVVMLEVLLNALALFNHANVRLPARVDALVRLLIVTPDMHRVHHSTVVHELNSNYGFNLSLWDRLFGSYCAQPAAGHLQMQIGLGNLRQSDKASRLGSLLLMPLRHRTH